MVKLEIDFWVNWDFHPVCVLIDVYDKRYGHRNDGRYQIGTCIHTKQLQTLLLLILLHLATVTCFVLIVVDHAYHMHEVGRALELFVKNLMTTVSFLHILHLFSVSVSVSVSQNFKKNTYKDFRVKLKMEKNSNITADIGNTQIILMNMRMDM